MKESLGNKATTLALSTVLATLSVPPLFAQADKTKAPADAQEATVGAFTLKVPNDWRSLFSK